VAPPVNRMRDGSLEPPPGRSEEQGDSTGDPIVGVVAHLNLGTFRRPAEIHVGILAATVLLFLATFGAMLSFTIAQTAVIRLRPMGPDSLRA
jgi:APA family basic amino acid/polyamine antiporter